jgi:predicted RNA-binding protein with RPS1 domain
MLVLGAVRAVNEVDLTVQLPHGLTGYVSMREISDTIATIVDAYIEQGERAELEAVKGNTQSSEESANAAAAITLPVLTDLIRVGQLVHCYILSVGEQAKDAASGAIKHSGAGVSSNKSRRIEISLRASLFNQNLTLASLSEGRTLYGSVKSIQEKGYVIDVGVSATVPVPGQAATNITAFLPFNKAPADLLLPERKRTGRLPKKTMKKEGKPAAADEDEEAAPAGARRLVVGMPIETVITNAKNKRVLVLTAEPSVVRSAVMRNTANETDADGDEDMDDATALKNTIGFTNLQPGMLVKASIVSVISSEEQKRTNARMSGLYVRFLDFFHGMVDNLHASPDASIEGALESLYREGQKVQARILYVNYITKKIALSLLPHIVAFEPFSFPAGVKCGDKVMDSIITRVEQKQGVYLRLPVQMEGATTSQPVKAEKKVKVEQQKKSKKTSNAADDADEQMTPASEEDQDEEQEDEAADEDAMSVDEDGEEKVDVTSEQSLSAWAHISRISDTHITTVPKHYTIGTNVPCRILNLHYLDGMVHVSTQPHILEQSILYYEDVHAGMEVQVSHFSVCTDSLARALLQTDEQLYLIFPNSLYWRFAAHTVEENFPPDLPASLFHRCELFSVRSRPHVCAVVNLRVFRVGRDRLRGSVRRAAEADPSHHRADPGSPPVRHPPLRSVEEVQRSVTSLIPMHDARCFVGMGASISPDCESPTCRNWLIGYTLDPLYLLFPPLICVIVLGI